jgi:Rad3-related DNA helicase
MILNKESVTVWFEIIQAPIAKWIFEEPENLPIKQLKRLTNLYFTIDYFLKNNDDSWYLDITDSINQEFVLKPTIVGELGKKLVWDNHERSLLMSGTILKPEIIEKDLGLEVDYVEFDCPFPKENRHIYILPGAPGLNASTINDSIENLAETIQSIVDAYPNSKILINTHSYKNAQMLKEHIKSDRFKIHTEQGQRSDLLEEFKSTELPIVLLSPSFSRGIDLDGPEFDCIIILKIPFPYLGDKQVQQRRKLKDGNLWYQRETAAALMQASFRALRSESKKCDIWILDGNWKSVYALFPNWYKDSMEEYIDQNIEAYQPS